MKNELIRTKYFYDLDYALEQVEHAQALNFGWRLDHCRRDLDDEDGTMPLYRLKLYHEAFRDKVWDEG